MRLFRSQYEKEVYDIGFDDGFWQATTMAALFAIVATVFRYLVG